MGDFVRHGERTDEPEKWKTETGKRRQERPEISKHKKVLQPLETPSAEGETKFDITFVKNSTQAK